MSDDFEKLEAAWSKLSGRDKITLLVGAALVAAGALAYLHREQLLRLWDRFHIWVFVAAAFAIVLVLAFGALRARGWFRPVPLPGIRQRASRRR